jgi:hypothetical protein
MIRFTTVTWYSQLAAIILGVGILFLGIFIGTKIEIEHTEPVTSIEVPLERPPIDLAPLPIVDFAWKHTLIDAQAEYPKSTVSLVISRSDGTKEERTVATVDRSCNEMPVDTKLAFNSQQLLCYYAGFGYQFRVISSNGSYEVQQKEIEEASPDYNPPIAEFKTLFTIGKTI